MRTVLITGSGSGLGRELALAWAQRGWRVVCTDQHGERAEQTCDMLDGDLAHLHATLNVTQQADFAALSEQLRQADVTLDVLVNNAGIASAGRLSSTPLDSWELVLNVNLMGVVRGCREFEPFLRANGGGHIVNIASFAGIANAPAMGTYNVAKAGVVSLSETLRTELVGQHIGVTVVCPSFFETNLLDNTESYGLDLKHIGGKLMAASKITASDVAACVLRAVDKNQFMCIPHRDARWLYRLKRWAPETFARMMAAKARGLMKKAT